LPCENSSPSWGSRNRWRQSGEKIFSPNVRGPSTPSRRFRIVSELDTRLSALFRATFPDLGAQDLADVTRDSVAGWDSIAVMTLFALIEEEFGASLALEESVEWTSYAKIRDALESRLRGR